MSDALETNRCAEVQDNRAQSAAAPPPLTPVLHWPSGPPIPLATEMAMLPLLMHWGRTERGMMRSQPAWRVGTVISACKNIGMDLAAALSLRRHHIKALHGRDVQNSAVGLGSDADTFAAAMCFEQARATRPPVHARWGRCSRTGPSRTEYVRGRSSMRLFDPSAGGQRLPHRGGSAIRDRGGVPSARRWAGPRPGHARLSGARRGADGARRIRGAVDRMQTLLRRVNDRAGERLRAHRHCPPSRVLSTSGAASPRDRCGAPIAPQDGASAVGKLLQTAERYVRQLGPGVMVFAHGCGEELAFQLWQRSVLVVDARPLDLSGVYSQQRTWCANAAGHILP